MHRCRCSSCTAMTKQSSTARRRSRRPPLSDADAGVPGCDSVERTDSQPVAPVVRSRSTFETRRLSMPSINFAGRAGRWSAAHWKTAALGWIAIAILAVAAGSAVGAKQMKSWAFANGESRRAEQMLADAGFRAPARESVLIQSRTARVGSPAFVAVVHDVELALSAQQDVSHIVLPTNGSASGLVSEDRHSALVQFDVRGDPENANDKIAPVLAVVDDVQLAHPRFVVGEFGLASADYSLNKRFGND